MRNCSFIPEWKRGAELKIKYGAHKKMDTPPRGRGGGHKNLVLTRSQATVERKKVVHVTFHYRHMYLPTTVTEHSLNYTGMCLGDIRICCPQQGKV